jgi:hypothetical protein
VDGLDDLGYVQKQVQVVGEQDGVLHLGEAGDGLDRISDLIEHLRLSGLTKSSQTIPGKKGPPFAGQDGFCPSWLLGQE